jgi:hypothetical protein
MRTWDPDGTRVKSGVALDLENGQTGENHRRTRAGSEPVETHRHFTIVAWCHHHCGTKSEDQSAWFFLLFLVDGALRRTLFSMAVQIHPACWEITTHVEAKKKPLA